MHALGRFRNVGSGVDADFIPLLPLWPGFALNTIFFAAVLWLVFCAAPGFARRRLRSRRGQCLHCGYDLRGQPSPQSGESTKCPECGRSGSRSHGEPEGMARG